MEPIVIVLLTGSLLAYSLISGRLAGTVLTAPLIFVAIGFVAGPAGLGVTDIEVGHSAIHLVAELTLILVLFTDAARIDLGRVRRDHDLPLRMLLVGLPLTIAAGAIVAMWLFPELMVWEALLLAALLAPTDAALGQAVVSARSVPVRIRQAINIESGLNDGIALPAVMLFAALASAEFAAGDSGDWIRFGILQVTLGPLVGLIFGYLGARLLDEATERGWVDEAARGIGILSLAILTYLAAEMVGGNGFIAAFVGGMVFGAAIRHPCSFLFEFMETEGQLLMLVTFFVFGIALLPEGIEHITPAMLAYAALSLTVIRMLPTTLSLVGARLRPPTWLFLGWFGPRGLASILFVLLILEESQVMHNELLLSITVVTVGLSVLLHGVTAAPLAAAYGAGAARMGECGEMKPACELPLREGPMPEAGHSPGGS